MLRRCIRRLDLSRRIPITASAEANGSSSSVVSSLKDTVVQQSSSSLFGGSLVAGLTSITSCGLFALTFGWHIGKPVYDAYTQDEEGEEGDNDEDD